MLSSRFCFISYVIALIGIYSSVFSENNVRYMKREDFYGSTCPVNFTVFDNNSSRSLVTCASRCSRNSSCYGIFHHPGTSRCIGCQKRFLINESAPSLEGANYYMRLTHKFVENKTTWNESQKVCEDLGGYLTIVTTEAEEAFIESNILSAFNLPVWLGGKNNGPMGKYLWLNGAAVADTYTKWFIGSPAINDTIDLCMVASNHDIAEWTWRTKRCDILRYPLCEFY